MKNRREAPNVVNLKGTRKDRVAAAALATTKAIIIYYYLFSVLFSLSLTLLAAYYNYLLAKEVRGIPTKECFRRVFGFTFICRSTPTM